jgi:FixJ family two-component response regulator
MAELNPELWGRTAKEIATELGISERAVYKRRAKAKAELDTEPAIA